MESKVRRRGKTRWISLPVWGDPPEELSNFLRSLGTPQSFQSVGDQVLEHGVDGPSCSTPPPDTPFSPLFTNVYLMSLLSHPSPPTPLFQHESFGYSWYLVICLTLVWPLTTVQMSVMNLRSHFFDLQWTIFSWSEKERVKEKTYICRCDERKTKN
jgi:hypothetical protein